MTTPAILNALADEVEQLRGPDRGLDARIEELMLPGRKADTLIMGRILRDTGDGHWVPCTLDARPYTSSLDAAATLMPAECRPMDIHLNATRPVAFAHWEGRAESSHGATEAIARCALGLRVRAALLTGGR